MPVYVKDYVDPSSYFFGENVPAHTCDVYVSNYEPQTGYHALEIRFKIRNPSALPSTIWFTDVETPWLKVKRVCGLNIDYPRAYWIDGAYGGYWRMYDNGAQYTGMYNKVVSYVLPGGTGTVWGMDCEIAPMTKTVTWNKSGGGGGDPPPI